LVISLLTILLLQAVALVALVLQTAEMAVAVALVVTGHLLALLAVAHLQNPVFS
jgi:hypothetical protein